MRKILKAAAGAAIAAGVAFAAPAVAGASGPGVTGAGLGQAGQVGQGPQGGPNRAPGHAVFVQTDNTAGNEIAAYNRDGDGTLTFAGVYATGGTGGVLNGSVVDHLASQDSLVLDQAHGLLYAVNAGTNTLSVFSVSGDRLTLRQILPSNGTFPVSIAVHGSLVYVLNALGGGTVSGYKWGTGELQAIPGSTRPLGLTTPTNTTQFTHTPGEVAFSPSGWQLIVTTKAAANTIDVFGVGAGGTLSTAPVVNSEPTMVPFAVTFDASGNLIVSSAGPDSLSSFTLGSDGILTPIDTVATGQAATCWVTSARGVFFASNAGSGSLSAVADRPFGQLSLIGSTPTDAGTVDAAATDNGQFLYVQTGKAGIVDEFRVGSSGTLSAIGSVTVPDAVGGEGIAAA